MNQDGFSDTSSDTLTVNKPGLKQEHRHQRDEYTRLDD
jgi:hypothetical protein